MEDDQAKSGHFADMLKLIHSQNRDLEQFSSRWSRTVDSLESIEIWLTGQDNDMRNLPLTDTARAFWSAARPRDYGSGL